MASTSIKEVLSLGRLKHLCLHMKSYPVIPHRHQGPNSTLTDIPLGMMRIVIHWMSATTTDFYKSLLSMQPRQPGLVFCSANSNAKQALPNQKGLKCVLVKGKEGVPKSYQKVSKKLAGFIHTFTYICIFFFPLICCPKLSSELNVLVLPCWNWKLSCGWETLLGRDPTQNSHTGSWAHPTGVNSLPQQDTGSVTCTSDSMECHKCPSLKVKVQHWTWDCSDPKAQVWMDSSPKLRICGCHLERWTRPVESKGFYQLSTF